MKRKLFQKRGSSWLLAALCTAEQLWLCLFACAFLHMHHVSNECHKTSDTLEIVPENPAFRNMVHNTELNGKEFVSEFVPVRTVPELDGWFENIWKDYRTGAIYEK